MKETDKMRFFKRLIHKKCFQVSSPLLVHRSYVGEIITSTHVTMLLYSGGMVTEVFVWAADTMIVGAVKKASGNCKV